MRIHSRKTIPPGTPYLFLDEAWPIVEADQDRHYQQMLLVRGGNETVFLPLFSRCSRARGGIAAPDTPLSPATFLDFRRQASSFVHLAAFRETPFKSHRRYPPGANSRGHGHTQLLCGIRSPGPNGPHTLHDGLDAPGNARTVMLSYALWQRMYAGNPDILGKTVQTDGEGLTIVGAMPSYFRYPANCDAWRPSRHPVPEQPLRPEVNQSNSRDTHYFGTIGRLKAEAPPAKAQADADTVARRLKQQYGNDGEMTRAAVITLQDDLIGETKASSLVLLGAVSLLLSIACCQRGEHPAGARSHSPKRNRVSRGSGCRACEAGSSIPYRKPDARRRGRRIGDLDCALWTYTASRAAAREWDRRPGIAAGWWCAHLHRSRVSCIGDSIWTLPCAPGGGFRPDWRAEGGRSSSAPGPRAQRVRSVLVISEVALAAVLLMGAGLLLRSFNRVLSIQEGFQPERVLSLQLLASQC